MEGISEIVKKLEPPPPNQPLAQPASSKTFSWEPIRPEPELLLVSETTITIPADIGRIPTVQANRLKCLIESSIYPIYLYGQAGSGKSCAAACVYRAYPWVFSYYGDEKKKYIESKRQVFFADAKAMIYNVSMRNGATALFNTLREASLVILDDNHL